MKKIKFNEVAHHYIGCDVIYTDNPNTKGSLIKLTGIINAEINNEMFKFAHITPMGESLQFTEIKPILRRLSSLTEEEKKQCGSSFTNSNKVFTTDEFLYLTKNGFDLFDLIDNGEAHERN